MKKTEGMPTLEHDASAKMEPPHPAVIEAENLRNALADERTKTEALARRCIRLGSALDAAIRADENRQEKDMFAHINGNCYHRKALTAEGMRRRELERKAAEKFEDACKKNAFALGASFVVGFAAVIFGFAGFIHTALAATIAGAALIGFGWALNDCVYLLGRCEK